MLAEIVKVKKEEVAALKEALPLSALQARLRDIPPLHDFRAALEGRERAIIAEVKKHSPSKGSLREDADPCAVARVYAENGAAAVSVLTDRRFFHGSPEFLSRIREALSIPLLRKDFIIDAYQIYETRLMGADALLLIAGLLPEERLHEYIGIARSLTLWPLVEAHNEEELACALAAGAEIIGINNRDLKTFKTDISNTLRLAPLVPPGKTLVSESGIHSREDMARLRAAGLHCFLIGEALMLAPAPGRKLRELLGGEEGQ